MNDVTVVIDPDNPETLPTGRFDPDVFDNTTEEQIREHEKADEAEAMIEMARYVRNIRERVGMTQSEFADRLCISLDTLRNWEQGRRYPGGAAKALLRIIERSPEAALNALKE